MEVALIGAVMALILLLQGPNTKELVIILPESNGHVGTLVVERGNERMTLNQAYAASRITSDGVARVEQLPQRQVQSEFRRTLRALPAPPVSFQLYFITGTDDLTEESKVELARMLEELRRRPAADIVVIGH